MKILLASKEKFLIKKGYSYLGIPKNELRVGRITTAIKEAPRFLQDRIIEYKNKYPNLIIMKKQK